MRAGRLALPLAFVLIGCQPAPNASPGVPTASPNSPTASAPASTWLAGTPDASATAELETLVTAMERAVLARDRAGYLSLVDLTDPVFALEHTRWVDDWADRNPASAYDLELTDVTFAGDTAVGLLEVQWSTDPLTSPNAPRVATFAVGFSLGPDGWKYAGEAWTSTEIPGFVIRVAPGLEASGAQIADDLPGIRDDVTAALDYAPAGTLQIKLYADSPSIVANTLLSLPDIAGWNEPGEALKLVDQGEGNSLAPTIAHEMTHFIGFDRAGTRRSRMPWWLDEGIATFVGSQVSGLPEDDRLAQVIGWEEGGQLAPWAKMTVFEETPLELWPFVYSQGYAMVRFVSEEIGVEKRNAWLAAMATEMDIGRATSTVLGLSFAELDAEFRDWLAQQR